MPPPRLKRSNVAGAVPASLEDAEIAINQADGRLFYRTAAGGVDSFSALPSGNSTMTGVLTVQPAVAPAAPDGSVQVIGDNTHASVTVQRNGDSAGQPALRFKRSRGTAASPTIVQTGDTMGLLAWSSITTTGAVAGVGQIGVVCTQTPQVGDLAGRSDMRFSVGNGAALQTVCTLTPTACNFSTVVNVNGQSVVVTNDARLSDTRTPTDASVTTAKLADGSVTTAKIAVGAVITVDIANSAVTYAKIQNVSATDRLLGRSSAGAGVVEEIVCTSYGRSLLSGADAAATRTTLGLGTAATSASTSFAASAHTHAATDIVSGTLADARLSANVVLTTDSRLSDARTPTAHTHGNLTSAGAIGSTSGLPIITTTGGALAAGAFGTVAGSFCQGNDSRLSDARTPTAHVHGNLTNAGAIGVTANLPVITTTSGVLTTGSFGNTANTFCVGNDSRLSDSRTPTAHTHGNITNLGAIGTTSGLPIITTTSGVLSAGAFGTVAGSFCQGDDSRLSNARTPTAHTHPASAITDFVTESAKYGPVTSVNGLTGAVTVPGVADGNKGDITVSASGATWTINANAVVTADIANSAVTYAKIQNVSATDRILGRSTAGAGVVEEITCTAFGRSVIAGSDAAAVRTTLNAVSKGGDTISGALTCTGAIQGQTGLTVSGARSLFRAVNEQYAVGSAYSATSGFVYFGAANESATPDAVISAAGGAALMTLRNGGNVGVGTTTPQGRLHVDATTNFSPLVVGGSDTVSGIQFRNTGATLGYIYYDSVPSLIFQVAAHEKMRIHTNGNVGIGTASPAVRLDVSGSIRASSGILFGADTAAANTLSDYEQGTWTPTFTNSGTNPTVTYGVNTAGTYTKIGRLVFANLNITLATLSAAGTGTLRISGLPFAAPSTFGTYVSAGVIASISSWGALAPERAYVEPGTSYIVLTHINTPASDPFLDPSNLTSTTKIEIALTYQT